ncbi:vitelline membrane outer layer protein 1-like [Gastrophryne carolinensis]
MSLTIPLLIVLSLVSVSLAENPTIGVPNGGPWGEWGPVEWCPCGYRARGFSLKVEPRQRVEDDTSLNGIRLHCLHKNNTELDSKQAFTIQSLEGPWGEWSDIQWCPEGFLISFSMQVEPHRKGGDDTAVNNFMFQCSDYTIFMGPGMNWGYYGKWSDLCRDGVCGIKTKVERPQASGDDTALNDVILVCCKP